MFYYNTHKGNTQKDQMLEPQDARGQESCFRGQVAFRASICLHLGTSEIIQTAKVLGPHMAIKTA